MHRFAGTERSRIESARALSGWGAAGQFLPALLNNWGVSADWLTILFGVGVLQVLTTAPPGLADQAPKDLALAGPPPARAGVQKGLLPGAQP